MDEDALHESRSRHERYLLYMSTSVEHSTRLWNARLSLRDQARAHWAAIGLAETPQVEQLARSSVSGSELRELFQESLKYALLVLYTDRKIFFFCDHTVISGHFGCKLLSWSVCLEWIDTFGLDSPAWWVTAVSCATVAIRAWNVPLVREFWRTKPLPTAPLEEHPAVQHVEGSWTVAPGTHPQAAMHDILSRVTAAWQAPQADPWTIVSAVPFKEVPGIANNIGAMSYYFPVANPSTVSEFRAQLQRCRSQVIVSSFVNRQFASGGGEVTTGAGNPSRFQQASDVLGKLLPDARGVRECVDALFSFMSLNMGDGENAHSPAIDDIRFLSCDDGQISTFSSRRLKAFIAAAYDKRTGRICMTVTVNLMSLPAPHLKGRWEELGLRQFDPFEP